MYSNVLNFLMFIQTVINGCLFVPEDLKLACIGVQGWEQTVLMQPLGKRLFLHQRKVSRSSSVSVTAFVYANFKNLKLFVFFPDSEAWICNSLNIFNFKIACKCIFFSQITLLQERRSFEETLPLHWNLLFFRTCAESCDYFLYVFYILCFSL